MPLRGDINESKEVLLHLLKLMKTKPALVLVGQSISSSTASPVAVGAVEGAAGVALPAVNDGNAALVVRAFVLYLQLPKVADEEQIAEVKLVLQGLKQRLRASGREAAVEALLRREPEVLAAFRSL